MPGVEFEVAISPELNMGIGYVIQTRVGDGWNAAFSLTPADDGDPPLVEEISGGQAFANPALRLDTSEPDVLLLPDALGPGQEFQLCKDDLTYCQDARVGGS